MADTVEVVIKIPKAYYKLLQQLSDETCSTDTLLIKYGNVLPKGHGDLVDRNWLLQKFTMGQSAFYSAPTIIKADSEVK